MKEKLIYKSEAGERAVRALYDGALAEWPVPYETRRVATRHGETFTLAAGVAEAPPLLLLHGAGSNSAIWAEEFAAYTTRYRVFAADLIGEPGRSAPNRPPWEGLAFAEWLADVLDGLDITEPVILQGISQGAWTALKFAVSAPERVSALVLLAPGGIVRDRLSGLLKLLPLLYLGRWGSRRATRLLFADAPIPEGVDEIMYTINRHFIPRVGVLPLFTDAELARLTMPVLLLGGTRDVLRDNAAIAERLRAHVPRLAVVLLRGAGHALTGTSAEVLRFLGTPEMAPAVQAL